MLTANRSLGGRIWVPPPPSASRREPTPPRLLGFDSSLGARESYPHLPINPVGENGHVSVHSRPVSLGTAGSPARVADQPPDAALQSDQGTSAVTLGDTARAGVQAATRARSRPRTEGGGSGWGSRSPWELRVGVQLSCPPLPRGTVTYNPETSEYQVGAAS